MFIRCTGLVILISASQLLQASPPSVERLFPATGQRGTSFTVTVVGAGLQNAVEAMLYSSEIRCERLEPKSDNELILHLMASANCPPGMHPVRIRSSEGISEVHVIGISKLSVVAEVESNDAAEDAQQLPLGGAVSDKSVSGSTGTGCTVVGTIEAGDVDRFRISLKKGDRLSAEAEAMRSGGTMLDAVLNVLSPQGEWLAAVDDTPLRGQDPMISMTVAEDGDYIVQLHESNFEGDESSRYALHIGSFPAPQWVYPMGGLAGQAILVTFGGDASGPIVQSISLQERSPGITQVFCEQNGEASVMGLPFRVSAFGNVMEQEPNATSAELNFPANELPVALNGILQEPGDLDCFRIRAEADQRFDVEVFASRMGSPVDTLLEIRKLDGTIVATSDDGISHDSQVSVTFPGSADYIVQISDKRGNGGEGFFYRVEISPFEPKLTAFLSRPNRLSQERQSIAVPRGNRVVTFLACQRSGFSGDVKLALSGLPDGVQLPNTVIPADRFWVPMVIEADSDADTSGRLVNVEPSAFTEAGTVIGHFRQVVDLVAASADQLFQSAEVDQLAVAVVDEVPYSISLSTPATGLAPDGTLNLQITATRAAGFSAPLEISFPFLPPWVDGPDKVIIPAGETRVDYPMHAWSKAVPRTWQICAEARPGLGPDTAPDRTGMEERGRRRSKPMARTAVASNLVDLTIADAPVAGSIEPVVAEQGKIRAVSCLLERRGELPQRLTAVLEGLPNRVTAATVEVISSDNTVRFLLNPEDSCPTGTFSDLIVRLTGKIDGQDVSWLIGRGSVLRIEPAGLLATDQDGKPLSRLDVLRREASRKKQ